MKYPERHQSTIAGKILEKNNICVVSFRQRCFYYYLNGLCVSENYAVPWMGTTACQYSSFLGGEKMRKSRGKNKHVVDDAGWHFSFLGGADAIALKIESFAHAEFDTSEIKDRSRLNKLIGSGKDLFGREGKPDQLYIDLDDSFPRYLQDNLEKFKHLIKR